jgi:hypothetical protein
MVQRREDVRFAAEPREAFGIVGDAVGEDLQCDIASELRVARAIDLL